MDLPRTGGSPRGAWIQIIVQCANLRIPQAPEGINLETRSFHGERVVP
jgi:hypothetical protein